MLLSNCTKISSGSPLHSMNVLVIIMDVGLANYKEKTKELEMPPLVSVFLVHFLISGIFLLSSCLQLSQLIVNAGGVAAIVDYLGDTQGNVRLPGVMMLGYVAAHSESLAMAVIVSKVQQDIQYEHNDYFLSPFFM